LSLEFAGFFFWAVGFERAGTQTGMIATAMYVAQGGGAGGFGSLLIPLGLMFGIMYFLVIMPQQRQRKKTAEMLAAVKNGDKVITTSGIYGTVNGIDGDTVILKIADQVKIRIVRAAIAQVEATEDAAK
jgi:preprotein translocase subunit YajC